MCYQCHRLRLDRPFCEQVEKYCCQKHPSKSLRGGYLSYLEDKTSSSKNEKQKPLTLTRSPISLFLLNIKNEYCALACGTTAPHRDLSANETYMAPPLIVAADLWDTTILAIQQLFGFDLLRALASLKGFKYKPCLNAYSEASISPFKLSLH